MSGFIRAFMFAGVALCASGCASVYSDAAGELPPDAYTRLELRVQEARESASAADTLLASNEPAVKGETWIESVDDCRWELARRVASVRDAAARVPGGLTSAGDMLARLDDAYAGLSSVVDKGASPGDDTVARARKRLGVAVAATERYERGEPPESMLARLMSGSSEQSTPSGAQ